MELHYPSKTCTILSMLIFYSPLAHAVYKNKEKFSDNLDEKND
jgi:hypothetical protein